MFNYSREHEDAMDYYVYEGFAYPEAEYDCTFEDRYLIYHAPSRNEIVYYAIDMKTNLSSEVCHCKTAKYNRDNYHEMTPSILCAIKYTGDRRFLNPYLADPEEMIDTIFRGILPQNGYTIREDQIELCKDIYYGLTKKNVSICEAEVGTGKSLAYLVAAICAKRSKDICIPGNEPITITTSSIELQTALVTREIPKLSEILLRYGLLKRPLAVALRKGREHYFCRFRYEDYLKSLRLHPERNKTRLCLLQSPLLESGLLLDLDKICLPEPIKERICVMGDCPFCSYANSCPYSRYLAYSMSNRTALDFQVTNHNLYLMSLQKQHILRSSSCVIIDEAHKIKDVAQDVFGEALAENDVGKYLRFIKTRCNSPESRDRFNNELNHAAVLNAALFLRLKELIADAEPGREKLIQLPPECVSIASDLAKAIVVLESLKAERKGKTLIEGNRLSEALKVFAKPSKILTWIEQNSDEIVLRCCPKNIGANLLECVWATNKQHILTSGTMSDGRSFDYFKRETGIDQLPKNAILETRTESPFAYDKNTRLYIPDDLPLPDNNSPEYISAISNRIIELINATNGHTAVLFTSYQQLRKVYDLTVPKLTEYEIFKMFKSDKTSIQAFRKSKNGVLFASGSIWEGVDVVGDTLSSIIIVRLPFPIRSATMEEKKIASTDVGTFVMTYAVPEMLIKLRQGAGRLIRSETDTGVISILDTRAARGGAYNRQVRQALEKYPSVDSVEEIREFLKSVKTPEYFNTEEK